MTLSRPIENRASVVRHSWSSASSHANVVPKLPRMNKFCSNWHARLNMCIITGNYVSIFFHSRDESKNGKLGTLKLKLNRVITEIAFKRTPIWLLYLSSRRNDCIFFSRGKETIILSILGTLNLNRRRINPGRSFCKGITKKKGYGESSIQKNTFTKKTKIQTYSVTFWYSSWAIERCI